MWLLKWNTENNGPQLDFLQFLQFSLKKLAKNSKSGGKFLFLLPKCMTENEALRY